MITTEAATNSLPLSVSRKPCCTAANGTVLAERDRRIGAGRAFPHRGLRVLQPWRMGKASKRALRGRRKARIPFFLAVYIFGSYVLLVKCAANGKIVGSGTNAHASITAGGFRWTEIVISVRIVN